MASVRRCDGCKAEITDENPLIAKLFLTPQIKGQVRQDNSKYTAHADIGACCSAKIIKGINWTKRKTNTENGHAKRLRPGATADAVQARAVGKTSKAKRGAGSQA